MSKQYGWAANPMKLARAIGKVGIEDESKIREEYEKIGGLLANGYEPETKPTPVEIVSEPVNEEDLPIVEGTAKPFVVKKKAVKKASKRK